MVNLSTKKIARAGVIAGLYVVLSLITLPVASGAIQFRISEGLTLLALIFPESCVALFVGCALSNLISGCAILDVVFGSLVTLASAVLTFATGKIIKSVPLKIAVGGIFPVILNALFLPLIWLWCYGVIEYVYYLQALFLFVSQALSVYAVGTPMFLMADKLHRNGTKFFE